MAESVHTLATLQTCMTDEEQALHQRILATVGDADAAAHVTRAEKNKILQRPPPEEEDRLCQEKVGLSMAALQDKVMTSDPDMLTELETDIILRGAHYNRADPNSGTNPFWIFNLPPEQVPLANQVRDLLADDREVAIWKRAYGRARVLEQQRSAEAAKRRAEAYHPTSTGNRSRWIQEMTDAKLPRWGFVIFRTAYGEGTDNRWLVLNGIYNRTGITHLHGCWKKAASLSGKHRPVWVSDASTLDGADVDALREKFKAMREQGDIPDRIATDCFLVADQSVLDHPIMFSKLAYVAQASSSQSQKDPWQTTFFIRAVDPDHDASAPIPAAGELEGFDGQVTIPLPKVFDWLYYCYFSKMEDWETRFRTTKEPAELLVSPDSPRFTSASLAMVH
jgi:hypothetical protein